MSRFYERYLQNLKLGEKRHGDTGGGGGNNNTKFVLDPTSMIGPVGGDGGVDATGKLGG